MAVTKKHAALLKKLKAQVKLLQKREEQSRNQLLAAFKKIQKLGKVYQNKLASNMRSMQNKAMAAQASTYAKAASDFEQQVLKNIKNKTLAVAAAIEKMEKKHTKKATAKGKKRPIR